MKIIRTYKQFISDLNRVHPNLTLIGNYINTNIKVLIKDKNNIEYLVLPSTLLKGISPEMKSAVDKNKAFIYKAKLIHGTLFDYSKSKYTNNKDKITIICKKHGEFKQLAGNHLKGSGCAKCRYEKMSLDYPNRPTGWSHSQWENSGKLSKDFESFKVYVLKCWNNEEEFYKIGKTFTSILRRFGGNGNAKHFPYHYKVIKIIEGGAIDISKLERNMHKENKENKYIPKMKFNGVKECFIKLNNIENYVAA